MAMILDDCSDLLLSFERLYLKTNLVTPNFLHVSFFVIWKWNYMIIKKNSNEPDFL